MKTLLLALFSFLRATVRSRLSMQMEIIALRHQLALYQRSEIRPRIQPADRLFWSCLSRLWSGWQEVLVFVQPRTVMAWRRRKFREYWTRLSRGGKPGRPALAKEIRDLIRRMSVASPTWGSPRILGELRKLGIDLAKSTVEKYMVRQRKPPSPTWRTFLKNHVENLVSIDFFVVPTVTFRVLFVFVVLAHHRRQVVHFNVTENPTAEWTAQQIVEAFPWDSAPRYLLRDRDGVYGQTFRGRVKNMGIKEVLIAPRSPWQTPYVERLFGSIRRECLANLVVLNERHLRRHLVSYFTNYHRWRCHQSLQMD
jgi:putative transposase